MSPLEKAMLKEKRVCCENCENRTKVKNINYCSDSGKIILDMLLDCDRKQQCIDIFKEGDSYN